MREKGATGWGATDAHLVAVESKLSVPSGLVHPKMIGSHGASASGQLSYRAALSTRRLVGKASKLFEQMTERVAEQQALKVLRKPHGPPQPHTMVDT